MKINTKRAKKISTSGNDSKKNGWLLELNSDKDNFTKFIKGQVYLTVVSPGKKKGFHLHKLKTNHITCVKGLLIVGIYDGKKILEFNLGEDNFRTIKVPPKVPLALYNRGKDDAYVINYCYPAYDPNVKEQEEVEIEWSSNED